MRNINKPAARARRAIIERDRGKCVYCSSTYKLSVDHIVAARNGGLSVPGNLVCACMPCNRSKSKSQLSGIDLELAAHAASRPIEWPGEFTKALDSIGRYWSDVSNSPTVR